MLSKVKIRESNRKALFSPSTIINKIMLGIVILSILIMATYSVINLFIIHNIEHKIPTSEKIIISNIDTLTNLNDNLTLKVDNLQNGCIFIGDSDDIFAMTENEPYLTIDSFSAKSSSLHLPKESTSSNVDISNIICNSDMWIKKVNANNSLIINEDDFTDKSFGVFNPSQSQIIINATITNVLDIWFYGYIGFFTIILLLICSLIRFFYTRHKLRTNIPFIERIKYHLHNFNKSDIVDQKDDFDDIMGIKKGRRRK